MQNQSNAPRRWSEVASDEKFLALEPEQQERARQLYFEDVVLPRVPAGMEARARELFDQDTAGGDGFRVRETAATAQQDGAGAMDFAKEVGAGALTGTGALVSGLGDAVRPDERSSAPPPPRGGSVAGLDLSGSELSLFDSIGRRLIDPARQVAGKLIDRPARAAGDWLTRQGESISESKSEAAKQAMQRSTPQGDIDKPSTWSFGDDPSLAGYGLHMAGLVGQFVPQAGAMLATRGKSAQTPVMMGVGGLQAGGSAANEVEQRIEQTPDDELQASSSVYRELRQAMSEQDARAQLMLMGRDAAFDGAAPVGALGGLATQITLGPLQQAVGGGIGKRLAAGLAFDAPAEGVQEVAETVAARASTNKALGEQHSLTEDTFGDAVLGAMGGAGHAGAGAILGGGRQADANEGDATFEDTPDIQGLPAPETQALPAPEQVFYGDSEGVVQDTGPVVNVDGEMRPSQQARQWVNAENDPDHMSGGPGMDQQAPPASPVPLEGEWQRGAGLQDGVDYSDNGLIVPREPETVDGEVVRPELPGPQSIVVDAEGNAQRGPVGPLVHEAPEPAPPGGRGMDRQAPTVPGRDEIARDSDILLRKNGKPFDGRGSARASVQYRQAVKDGKNPAIVRQPGGWGIAIPKAAAVEMRPVDAKAAEAATSPDNDLPMPTLAQIEAGNYKKGHVRVDGLDIAIENPRGSERSGTDPDGNEWRHTMSDHYGYIKRSRGADGEQVDVYIGPAENTGTVYVVDQVNQQDGSFDEHKVMMGYPDRDAAVAAYRSNFDEDWKVGEVTEMPVAEFKQWLKSGDTQRPLSQPAEDVRPVLQNRDRSTPASITQMRSIAANPDYGRLGFSRDFTSGAPVVEPGAQIPAERMGREDYAVTGNGRRVPVQYAVMEAADVLPSNNADGTVNAEYAAGAAGRSRAVAGNGRAAGLQQAYRNRVAGEYMQAVMADTELHGIKPEAFQGMKQPVLVRVMPKEEVTQDIGDESNTTGTAALSGVEQAANDARRIDLDGLRFSEDGRVTDETVRQFIRSMPQSEQAGLLDGSQPSRQAHDRLAGAIFASAYESNGLTRLQAQAADPEMRNVMSGLLQAAPKMARLKGAGDLDIRPLVAEAAEVALNARRQNVPLAQFAEQADIQRNPEIEPILQVIADNSRSAKRIGEQLGAMADRAYAESVKPAADMFGEAPKRSRAELLNAETEAGGDIDTPLFSRRPSGATSDTLSRGDVEQVTARLVTEATVARRFVFASWEQLPQAIKDAAAAQGARPGDIKAVHWRGKTYLVDRRFADARDVERTIFHEYFAHYGLRQRYGKDLERQMNRMLLRLGGVKGVRRMAKSQGFNIDHYINGADLDTSLTASQRGALVMDELLAHMAEATGTLKRALQEWYGAVRNWLRENGWAGLARLNAADLAFELRGARQAALSADQDAGPDAPPAFQITRADNATVPATRVETPEFKRWFGGSKVVDTEGRPLVVYHGTNSDFSVFDESKAGQTDSGWYGRGFYFTPNPNWTFAEDAADSRGGAANVMPAYVSLTNPMYAHAYAEQGSNLVASAKERGMDGVIVRYDPGHELEGQIAEVIAFRPEQIKSATGNNGQFDPANPDIRFSRKARHVSDAFSDLTPEQQAALRKIGTPPTTQRAADWFREKADRAMTKIRQGIVDKYAALKELDEKLLGSGFTETSITDSSWVLARMAPAASGALTSMLHHGRIRYNAGQKLIGMRDDGSLGLGELFGRLGGASEVERFFGWMAGNRAEKLAAEGRENLFSATDIAALKNVDSGTTKDGRSRKKLYAEVFKEFQQYRDDVLSIAEATGIISTENRAMWRDEFYVPFYRVMDEEASAKGPKISKGLSRQEAYKKLKGGKQNLNDLMENTLMNFHHLLTASLKNQAARQAIDNAKAMGIATPVKGSNRDAKTDTFVLQNGEQVWYRIDDPLVFEALSSISDAGINNLAVRTMAKFKRVFTNFTTITPQFIVANFLRDSMQAAATSPVKKNVPVNMFQGARSYTNQKVKAQMLASGGAFSFGHIYGTDPAEIKAGLKRSVRGAKLIDAPKMVPKLLMSGWDAYNEFANTAENVNRAAIYEQNKDAGELRAAFEARDLMDFSSEGSWPAVRFLIRVVPFLNARLQGLDKLYRAGFKPGVLTAFGKGTEGDKKAAARFATVTGALTMASMALYLANWDDEEYRKLEDWQKDTYWFFRVGDNAFFLPKPFEVGAIATMVERTLEQFIDDKATGKLFRERLWDMLMQTFSFSPVPQAFQPALDVYSNKDAFTGREIETAGMERLSPTLRTRASTTAPARAISHASQGAVSPVQADHLIRGYLGQVGAWGAGIADTIWRSASGETSPAKHWHEYQPVRRFYRDLGAPAPYTRYSTLFYEGLRESGRVYADVKRLQELGHMDEARKLVEEKRDMLAMRKQLNQVQSKLSAANARIDAVRRSDRSAEEKRRELDRLNAYKGRLTEMAGKRLEEVKSRQ